RLRKPLSAIWQFEKKETRVILPIVFDRFLEDFGAVDFGGGSGRNRAGVFQAAFHQHLDTAGGVIKRRAFDSRILFEEASALVQRDRMRKYAANLRKFHPWGHYQIVYDPNKCLAADRQVIFQKQIIIFVNRAM